MTNKIQTWNILNLATGWHFFELATWPPNTPFCLPVGWSSSSAHPNPPKSAPSSSWIGNLKWSGQRSTLSTSSWNSRACNPGRLEKSSWRPWGAAQPLGLHGLHIFQFDSFEMTPNPPFYGFMIEFWKGQSFWGNQYGAHQKRRAMHWKHPSSNQVGIGISFKK